MTNLIKTTKLVTLKAHLADIKIKQYFLFTIAAYFLIGMHYFQFHDGGIGLNLPINPIGWIVISILVALGILQIAKTQNINYNPFIISLAIGCIILLIPLFYAPNTGWYSHSRLLGLFAGLALLFSILQMNFTTDDFHKILRFILIAAFIESIVALIQFYILPYQSVLNISTARPSAIFFQANVAATFFVTGLLISLYLLQRNQSKIYKAILYISPVTISTVIVLLQSRTAFIGAIIGIVILQCHKHRSNTKWLSLVILGLTIAVTSLTLLERQTRELTGYNSPGGRSQIYGNSIDLIIKKPIFGHGYGTFSKVYLDIQAEKYLTDPERPLRYEVWHPHNELLLWLVEGGGIALIAITIIGCAIFFTIFQQKHQAYFKFALIFPISFHTLTELPFYHSVASWLVFLLLLAFISNVSRKQLKIAVPNTLSFKGLAILIAAMTIIQMISLLYSQKILTHAFTTQNSASLFKESLPFVSNNFEFIIHEKKLYRSIEMNLNSGVTNYIKWATRQTNVAPRPRLYRNLIKASLYFNNLEQAIRLQSQARHHFPTKPWTETELLIRNKQQGIKRVTPGFKVN